MSAKKVTTSSSSSSSTSGSGAATASILEVLQLEAQAIDRAAARIRESESVQLDLHKTILLLDGALKRGSKIIVSGLGKSGKVAEKIAATLSSTGSLAVFLHATEGLHGDLGIVAPGDVVIALSQTGNTDEWRVLVPSLKKRQASLVVFSGARDSFLVSQADHWVNTEVEREACPHNLAPTTSTTLMLAMGDALAIALMRQRGLDLQNFAENHPGGALGRRMTLTVGQVMHPLKQTGQVSPQALMPEVIEVATRTKLGGVCVVHDGLLLGIITDGDLRRALGHREKFFILSAKEVMTASPVVTHSETLATQALEVMQNRSSQISVLPVLDEGKHLLGLVRLHDLVQLL